MSNIWASLSRIDVSDKVEKKGNLSYLSWAWAWGTVKELYPTAQYEVKENVQYPDGSVEVWVVVKIEDQVHGMWLPVMDHKNNAIKNPDARKISDARMRCLTKCLAMFGLGHYIYAGEDIPMPAKPEPINYEAHRARWEEDPIKYMDEYLELSEEDKIEVFNSAPKGEKTGWKNYIRSTEAEYHSQINDAITAVQSLMFDAPLDFHGVIEVWDELSDGQKKALWASAPEETKRHIRTSRESV